LRPFCGGFLALAQQIDVHFINIMPRGIPFKRDMRELVQHHFREGKSPDEVATVFVGQAPKNHRKKSLAMLAAIHFKKKNIVKILP
jgi:hypothetical protein